MGETVCVSIGLFGGLSRLVYIVVFYRGLPKF